MTPAQIALLTPEEREAWERCGKATPGPWQTRFMYRMFNSIRQHASALRLMVGLSDNDWSDADFCAHARTDLPAALRTIADLREILSAKWIRDKVVLPKLHEAQNCGDCNEGYWCQGAVDAVVASREDFISKVEAALAERREGSDGE